MSNITITSTTSSKEELEHAAGPNWREPFVPAGKSAEPEAESPEGEEPETAAATEPAEETESDKPKPAEKKSGWQKRIDKLTARNHRLETELEEARKAKPAEQPAAQAQTPSGPPKLQEFLSAGKTADEWADARDAWKQAESEKSAQQEQIRSEFDTYNKGVSEARGKYDDWDEVVTGNNIEIPSSVQLAVIKLGNEGPDVAYYLGKHPEFCEELLETDPLIAVGKVYELARTLKPASNRSPEQKQKTKPPAPLSPVGASSTRSSIPLDQLPPREYNRIRDKQERERGR